MQKILVAGGTGLIGSNLITKLKQKNFKVILLTTQKNIANGRDIFYWQPKKNIIPLNALEGVDCCINLCGAGIFAKRFTHKRKLELLESRVQPADLLFRSFQNSGYSLKHYISSSATGFYENICSEILTENSTKGQGFISDLVEKWEHPAHRFESSGCKVTIIRTGIVFSEKGGFLKQLSLPVKLYVGAVPGSGQQVISWIHVDDLTDMFIHILEHGLKGTFNATADQPESLGKITKQVADVLKRPMFLPNIPEFMLRLIFGERYELLLTSQIVSNEKIKSTGFKFHYKDSGTAIKKLLANK